ncbi:hypothetical protein BaRGS_00006014 [Batillaria attramentaria]|uniref:Beta-hexosaminidase bacterial type N-terminal domain-containing protein n=1 Tax=Batillaria attramentaria TaxID=370345 RepID=A0ABD0LUR9_9CAEN
MTTAKEIISQLKTAIDSERTDIVCSVISELQKHSTDAELLKKVLGEPDVDGGTLLHYAVKAGKQDKVRALLAGGADPCVPNAEGKFPFDLATSSLRTVFNEELLQATAQSNLGRVCQLLAAGVDVNVVDSPETQSTPLHWAASYGNKDIVQCLCCRGASPNAYNASGMTPLHEAVRRGDRSVVDELLEYGADPELTVSIGEFVGQNSFDLAGDREDLLQALKAPHNRDLLSVEGVTDGMHPIPGSKANLVRFDSLVSTDTALTNGGGDEPSSPKLMTPTFKKLAVFEDVNATSPLKPVVTEEKLNLLWPQPQSIVQGGGKHFVIKDTLNVLILASPGQVCPSDVAELWNVRRPRFEALGVNLTLDLLTSLSDRDVSHVVCHVSSRLCPGYGTYKLTINPKQMKIVCGTAESLGYAIATLLQLMSLYKGEEEISIPTLLIDDWPELPYRGVLLDFSQGRVPNMVLLEEILDTLSTLKLNQVFLYARFRTKTPPQWQFCYTRREVLHLVDYCRQRQLNLLPVLEVGPKVQFEDLSLLYSIFSDFLACFSHADFVSCGPRLSSFLLDTSGEGDMVDVSDASKYVPLGRDQTLQLCGYPIHDLSSSMLQHLPPNVVFNEYGVKADHDFNGFCTSLAELGVHFFVCPGTAAWNSLAGCPEAALSNIFQAVKAASSQGALGAVVCDWTGKGHLTHQPFSWPGFLLGAGLSWNTECHWDYLLGHLSELLSHHVYNDALGVLGEAIIELGRAETFAIRRSRSQAGDDMQNLPEEQGSILFRLLTYPDGVPLEHLSTDALQCQTALSKMVPDGPQSRAVTQELLLTMDLMLLACKIGKALVLAGRKPGNQSSAGFSVVNFGVNNLTATARTDLANRLLEMTSTYKTVWTQHYLDSIGLSESLSTLRSLLRLLLPDSQSESLFQVQSPPSTTKTT